MHIFDIPAYSRGAFVMLRCTLDMRIKDESLRHNRRCSSFITFALILCILPLSC